MSNCINGALVLQILNAYFKKSHTCIGPLLIYENLLITINHTFITMFLNTLMPSSHCTIFKLGSLLFSHCMTIWGSIRSLLCSHCAMDQRQGVSHCMISQQEESQTILSDPQTTFYNKTHVISDKKIMREPTCVRPEFSSWTGSDVIKKHITRKLSVHWFTATKRKHYAGGKCREQGLCVLQREVKLNNTFAVTLTVMLMLQLLKQMFVLVSVWYYCTYIY